MNVPYHSHSAITQYPPNPLKYPKFYNCKEHVFILYPGDMLYIPEGWCHWVFSFKDKDSELECNNENIAISFHINKFNGIIYNKFYDKKPFVYNLDKTQHSFFDITFEKIKNQIYDIEIPIYKSKGSIITPTKKNDMVLKYKVSSEKMKISKLDDLQKQKKYNMYMSSIPFIFNNFTNTAPNLIRDSFPGSTISHLYWFGFFDNNTESFDSGLHFDQRHNCLIQIKGTKLVRLYNKKDFNNLYIQPMHGIN